MDQHDPIYGEISITLLAEMSVLPSLAEVSEELCVVAAAPFAHV